MSIVRFAVRVRPGASRTHVGGTYGPEGTLCVAVTARAVDGAANDAVLVALADALGLRRRELTIVSGHTARTKVIAAQVADDGTLAARLAELSESA